MGPNLVWSEKLGKDFGNRLDQAASYGEKKKTQKNVLQHLPVGEAAENGVDFSIISLLSPGDPELDI